jgi:Fic family protein
MPWNWQLPEWPNFTYRPEAIAEYEKQFLLRVGAATASLTTISNGEYKQFIVEILSKEALESSSIEGESLDRESLQSSIKRHFGLQAEKIPRNRAKETGMAQLLCDVYDSFKAPLTHEILCKWHGMLFGPESTIEDRGKYRTHPEPMQIVSRRHDRSRIYFEAPPSDRIQQEMESYLRWFNDKKFTQVLGRAAIGHLYFENIHPFEDGNGRIGRAIVEKILSQSVERPVLIAVSNILEQDKKGYYAALESCNRSLEATAWVEFFAEVVIKAQDESLRLLKFLIDKSKVFNRLSGQINPRQEKALLRLYESGPEGFKGGLSAEKYIAITKASRATATRDLAELVKLGVLVRTGELRHTRYWLQGQGH